MAHKIIKAILALFLAVGGILVIVDAFGTATAKQYLFNLFYVILVMPACVGLWFKVNGEFEHLK